MNIFSPAVHPAARLARWLILGAALGGAALLLPAQTTRVNLAKYQLATASAQQLTYAYDPEFAVDGIVSNFSSYRTGNRTSAWWLQIDHKQSLTIGSAHVYLGQVGSTNTQVPASFKLQSSSDGTNWTDVPGASVTGNTQVERNLIFNQAVTARYFRFYSTVTGSYTIRELALFPPNVVGGVEQGYPIGTDVRLNLAFMRPATSSAAALTNTFGPGYPKNAFDGYIDNASRWVLASTAAAGEWIEVELGDLPKRPDATSTATAPTPVYLGSAHVYSGGLDANRVLSTPLTDFKLQSWDATTYAWVDIPGATIVGNTETSLAITFTQPVLTSNVRLITTVANPARLHELLLFPPSTNTSADLSISSVTKLGREVTNAAPPTYTFAGYFPTGTAFNGTSVAGRPYYKNTWDQTFPVTNYIFPTYSDSNYRLNSAATGLRLGLVGGNVVFAPTTNTTTAEVEWQLLLNVRDGSYRIRNPSTGLCLGLSSVTTDAGTAVTAQTYSALPSQDWFLIPDATTPTNLRLVNVYSGLALQSAANSTTAGAAAIVDTITSDRAVQQWTTQFMRYHPKKGIAGSNNIISTSSDTTKRYSTSPTLTFHEDFYNRLGGSWSYTWGRQTSDTYPYLADNQAFTFNPMQWGNGNNNFWVNPTIANGGQGPIERNYVDLQASAKPIHLLGYNEPDHADQGDTTVAEAIARWPRLEAMQAPLVGPCPADPDGTWQNDFYVQANALGYRRDYTPVHWYAAPNAGSLISTLQSIYNTYGRPIWLTEFSNVSWTGSGSWTDNDNYHFLAEFMWRAESLTWLKRYSLFVYIEGSGTITSTGVNIDPANAPRSNSVRADGSLTAFGQLYAGWDGVTSVVNNRAYHLQSRSAYHRVRNPGGTANPTTISPETADAGVQWFRAPGNATNSYRLISTRDGRPLQSDGTSVTLGTVGQNDDTVQWKTTAYQYGMYYLEHVATSKRLKNNSGSLTMVAGTTADDTVRWRLVAPAVADTLAAPTISSSLTASGTVDSAFSYQITTSTFATGYTAAGLPAGLTLDTSTGLISGTPTTAGQYSVSLSATNYTGTGATSVLNLTVAKASQAAPVISSASSMIFGTSYTATANTGFGALTWALGTGSTAPSAAINATTGAVTSTGTGTVVINATFAGDADHHPATSADFVVTVAPVNGTTFTLNATSFTYTGAAQGPTIIPTPANATFTAGGTTSATNVGTYTATATANGNFSGSNNNLSWSITKANQPTPVINSASSVALGSSYTATANAGFGATSWALGSGSTAAGAAINSTTGVVTFTSVGTVVFRATFAGDGNHNAATSADFTLTVNAANLYWDGSGTPNATTGITAYNPNTNWSTVAGSTSNTTDPAAVPGASDTAVFGLSTPMLVGLNGNRTVGGIQFSGTGNTTLYSHPSANTTFILTLGTGGLTINSGTGQVSTVSNSTNGFLSYRLSGNQSWINNSANPLTMNGLVSNSANAAPYTLTLGGSGAGGITLASNVTNNGTTGTLSLVVNTSGNGTTTLSGTNTFTGATTVAAGLLKITNDRALGFGGIQTNTTAGTVIANGGTLDLNGRTINEALTISGSGVGDNGALLNTANTTATIGSGVAGLTFTALGSTGPLPTITFSGAGTGATAVVTGSLTAASITLNSGTTTYSVAPTVSISGGGGSGATATATLTSGLVTAINLTNGGSGYTSAPTITFGTGTVNVAGTNPTATANANNFTPMGVQVTAAGTDYTSATSYAFSGGTGTYTPGNVTVSSVTLAADTTVGGAGNLTVNAAIGESSAGKALLKIGAGTLTLMGNNTYTGATTVSAGTLSGSGTLAGALTITATGALSPGTSSATGIFSAASASLAGTTTLRLNGPTRGSGYDALNVTGALTYGGALVLSLPTYAVNDSDSFQLFQAGSTSGAFTSVTINTGGAATATLTETGFTGTINGKPYTFSYATGLLKVATPVTFALNSTSFVYTGAVQGPTVTSTPADATFTTGGTLAATDIGTYTATATATGDYTGSDSNLTWSITKADQTAPVITSWPSTSFDASYTATANTGFGAVSWSLGSGSTAAGAAIDATTGAVSFTSIGTVVIRATFAGDASRNPATSADFTVTVNPATTGFTLINSNFTYTGAAQGPTISPTLANATFVTGGTLSATAVGDYTATATATDNYVGSDNNLTWSITKATPVLTWSDPAAITYGTALSSTQLNASSGGVAGTFTYDPASGTVLTAGTHTLNVAFTPNDSANYNSATASVSLTVDKATPSLSWSTPSAITYGTALSSTQLNASSGGVAGTFTYDPASGTVLTAGTHTLNVAFTPNDSANYNSATASVSLTVDKATPSLSWSTPSAITYGTALSSTQLNASAGGVAGTFTYDPASGTVLTAGTHTLNVAFTPNDSANYNSATATVSLTVNKATATVSLSDLTATYDGTAKPVTVTTNPTGLTTVVTYDGSSTAPSAAGSYTVEAAINDSNYTGSATDTLVIISLYRAWAATYFTASELLDDAISGPAADPDHDGLANLLEYALNENPRTATTNRPSYSLTNDSRLQLVFSRARSELTYEVLASSDLASWSVIATNPGTVGESVTVTDSVTLTGGARRFLRLRVTDSAP